MSLTKATTEQLWAWHADIIEEIQRRGRDAPEPARAPWDSGERASRFETARRRPSEPVEDALDAEIGRLRLQLEAAQNPTPRLDSHRPQTDPVLDDLWNRTKPRPGRGVEFAGPNGEVKAPDAE